MEQYGRSTEEVLCLLASGSDGLSASELKTGEPSASELKISETSAAARLRAGGLSASEAAERLKRDGRNVLKGEKRKSKLALFFAQFKDFMTLILIAAACLSGALALATGVKSELVDTVILLVIILLNAVVGFLQQYRADNAIEKLKKLSVCTAKAVRGGVAVTVDAEELVKGDVIELEEGDRVPADCRILSSSEFRCDESALTGESEPVKKYDCIVKKSALSERKNTAHMGTFCVKGSARCVVVATGMETEMGKIASLLKSSKPSPSPLDKTVARLGKILTAAVSAVAALLFLGGMLARRLSFLQCVMNAVAVAVAAIPEGMGAVVTVILAMGVRRMAKSRAVVRRLSAVEALGSCSVICSDKTGTLTENRMTVEEIVTDFSTPSEQFSRNRAQNDLLFCMRLCHTVKGEKGRYLGDPTEVALVEYADRCGVESKVSPVLSLPFTSERRRMAVLAEHTLYEKGALDVLLPLCAFLRTNEKDVPLTPSLRRQIEARAITLSSRALRVLAFAEGKQEGELCFLGLAAMLDPPKKGAKEAVAACARAGVRTVMITGDSKETAFAIATRLGIATSEREVITGEEIDELQEKYFPRAEEFSVYARVSPRHKQTIVRALQQHGEVVAMTGDGVNDAPALRAADVGVAMGSGTDVTKNAADLVLADDDFSTMVRAVEEGRNVFFNIKRTISFFLSTNFAEVLCVLVASLLLWRYDFLTSTQLLWVNLITDTLPVLALGVERTEGTMERSPVSDREIFSFKSLLKMALFGTLQAAIVLGLFMYGLFSCGNGAASTMAFLALSLCELFHAFNVRTEDGNVSFSSLLSDRPLLWTVALGVLLNVLLVALPVFRTLFGLTKLSGGQWAAALLSPLLLLPFGWLKVKRHRRNIPLREMPR